MQWNKKIIRGSKFGLNLEEWEEVTMRMNVLLIKDEASMYSFDNHNREIQIILLVALSIVIAGLL